MYCIIATVKAVIMHKGGLYTRIQYTLYSHNYNNSCIITPWYLIKCEECREQDCTASPHLRVGSSGHSLWALLSSTLQSDNWGSQWWGQNGAIHWADHNLGDNWVWLDLQNNGIQEMSLSSSKSLSKDSGMWSGNNGHWEGDLVSHTQRILHCFCSSFTI